MKIQFDPELDFQHDAIKAISDIFEGQETLQTNFTVTRVANNAQDDLFANQTELGTGNKLNLLDEDLLDNIRACQIRQGLKQSEQLDSKAKDFTVEMETGTGKTYVYLRSIFELNERFGFTKFIIVVPSIAIKEGVYKSLQMTEQHFKSLYNNSILFKSPAN